MSEVIDSKVVELKFNNKEFEKNVQTSLSTLDKLKKSLTFDNVTKGVTALSSTLGAINLRGISGQIKELTNIVDDSVSPVMNVINTIGGAITNTIGGAINGVIGQIESGGMSRPNLVSLTAPEILLSASDHFMPRPCNENLACSMLNALDIPPDSI